MIKSSYRIYSFLLLVLLVACGSPEEPTEPSEVAVTVENLEGTIFLSPEQMELAGVEVGSPQLRQVSDRLRVSGRVEVPPQSLVSVHSPIKGFVQGVDWLPGDRVKKGSLLTRIRHRDLITWQSDYHETKAKLDFLEQEVARKETLADAEAGAVRLAQQASSELAASQAHLAALAAELRMLGLDPDRLDPDHPVSEIRIYAPSSGVISEVTVNIGKLVQPEDLLFEIVDLQHTHVEMDIYARDLASIAVGQSILIYAPGRAEPLAGEVHLLGPKIDPVTKTARVHGHFAIEPAPITPGAMVEIEILTEAHEALTVPESAVVLRDDQAVIFLREGTTFKPQRVAIGRIVDGYAELLDSKLTTTSTVAVSGAYYLMGSLQGGE